MRDSRSLLLGRCLGRGFDTVLGRIGAVVWVIDKVKPVYGKGVRYYGAGPEVRQTHIGKTPSNVG